MRIRAEQMEVFRPLAEADFLERVVAHLLKHHHDVIVEFTEYSCLLEEVPRGVLREMVAGGLARGRGYGMEWESTLCGFVVLMFVAAPNFDEHPLIRRVLEDERVPPDSRLKMLWRRVSDQTWEAAEERYDGAAWGVSLLKNPDGVFVHAASGAAFPPAADARAADETPFCPECGEAVPAGAGLAVGAAVNCEECGSDLRVTAASPVELESLDEEEAEGPVG